MKKPNFGWQWCWWLYDGDWFEILLTKSLCWWIFSLCWWFSQCIKLVINILNRSPTSQTCHQHIWSPKSITNIDVTPILDFVKPFWAEILKTECRPCFHNVGSYATAFLYFIETDTTIGTINCFKTDLKTVSCKQIAIATITRDREKCTFEIFHEIFLYITIQLRLWSEINHRWMSRSNPFIGHSMFVGNINWCIYGWLHFHQNFETKKSNWYIDILW